MDETNKAKKEETTCEINQKKVQKIRFCIISNFKSQLCKNNLMFFALDNN